MGGRPTDLLGWADEMDRVADLFRDEGLPRILEEGNRDLAKMLRQAAAENAALREALEEREHDMHLRIRAGYDKTVADSWRAANAKLQAENAALRERVAVLGGSDVPVSVMEFTVVRVATAGKWFAKGWVNGQIVRGPDALSIGEAVNAYCVALTDAKPAAQEGTEAP